MPPPQFGKMCPLKEECQFVLSIRAYNRGHFIEYCPLLWCVFEPRNPKIILYSNCEYNREARKERGHGKEQWMKKWQGNLVEQKKDTRCNRWRARLKFIGKSLIIPLNNPSKRRQTFFIYG